MDLNKEITRAVPKRNYLSPSIAITIVAMESALAAGSTVIITIENNNTPYVVEWEERQSEQTWNF
ncbi:hypothetical protein [Sphingobacterium corticibacter]|uniref:Uncharacterized protein n=1 Tax=Sphingobacterium corticibacter TaxID=2171749 RepID=A0A2T8HI77_9SPHI|nr:hypothetical protein [Sphingobacterium corticibacter]PVH25158.1 hypothetical protein DC487_09520 [Sphingobacterium corticibacter]